jgi:hypothetical protein
MRWLVAKQVGSLPSCKRWYGFDATHPEQGPVTGSYATRRALLKAHEDGDQTAVLSAAEAATLPLYLHARETGNLTLTDTEAASIPTLRRLAKREGLLLISVRTPRSPHASRYAHRPYRVTATTDGHTVAPAPWHPAARTYPSKGRVPLDNIRPDEKYL